MKKVILVLLLVAVITGGAFAQANIRANWISGEVSMLGVGARYEYMFSPKFSVGANAYFNNLFLFWNDWAIDANMRFYPTGKFFFAELGLGYSFHSGTGKYKYTSGGTTTTYDDTLITINGFGIIPGVGWKIDVGAEGGFFIQPGVKLPITLGSKKPVLDWWGDQKGEFGAGVGIVFYCGFGYAF